MAPGEYIYTAAPDNSVAYWSGTSFAAPIVSGAAALALGEVPSYPKLEVKDVIKKLGDESRDIKERGRNKDRKAEEMLDIDNALQELFK